mmetsp:Transcript_34969/g.88725  ORF Transcript_34969/g.88725 Transcript_34969/m.88725 type:complete len:209 (-) Transcript_34969:663-1289(-)
MGSSLQMASASRARSGPQAARARSAATGAPFSSVSGLPPSAFAPACSSVIAPSSDSTSSRPAFTPWPRSGGKACSASPRIAAAAVPAHATCTARRAQRGCGKVEPEPVTHASTEAGSSRCRAWSCGKIASSLSYSSSAVAQRKIQLSATRAQPRGRGAAGSPAKGSRESDSAWAELRTPNMLPLAEELMMPMPFEVSAPSGLAQSMAR